MVVGEASINNIMGGIESTGGVRLHNHKRKLKQRFDIIKKLGQGTYGKVQLGINKETGQEVAIKTIKKSKIETEADLIRIRREIQIMSSVQHPNIIHIYEVFENREKMVLVMEYAAGGELYDYLSERKVLAEEEARRIFRQIATASYYCHKHKICHRDLKLENILLDENGNAKIADFGLSNVFDETRLLSTFCGSPLYASPEIVKGTPYHGPEVDCWSLGVLLYTLVYGAMPFDGSNFKRLVKTISQGDYYEPKKPSSASPLIRDMLTVNPRNRADIEKICTHWWVNEGYSESCLDISEYLANQTPVRLDLLLSLAPPPPQLESDKLVVTGEVPEEPVKLESGAPIRSQSVGSLMELSHPAERRIKDLLVDLKTSPKRKLENAVSSDHANVPIRKDKIIKENTVADISVHATIQENASQEDATMPMSEAIPLDKSRTQTLSRDMDVEPAEESTDPSLQGAACSEIIEESKQTKKSINVTKTPSTMLGDKILEEINETPSQENLCDNIDKENVSQTPEQIAPKPSTKPVKKGVLVDKNDNTEPLVNSKATPQKDKQDEAEISDKKTEVEPEHKPIERRKSRIYEQAEKFQNMIAASESKTGISDKPKKVILPGVSVDIYKKEFERKASLTSTSPPKLKGSIPKRISIDKQPSTDQEPAEKSEALEVKDDEMVGEKKEVIKSELKNAIGNIKDDERKKQLKNAVSIITNALDKEGARKSKSRPCIRKPPVPFGVSGRSASGSIGMITSPVSPINEDFKALKLQIDSKAKDKVAADKGIKLPPETESKTSSAEITLKSATLPRRKTTKAEIQLNYPQPKPATMEFKTEMAHRIEAPPKLANERTEAVFPVSGIPRSSSLEPETKAKQLPKERIIPISFEKQPDENETVAAAPKPPTPKILQNQKSYQSQRSNSLSRQSTQESDSETVSGSGEPIRKSPREYIIPIAVEGGGYVTPRAGSLEPSDTASTTSTMTNNSRRTNKFGRSNARRMNSLLSDRDNSEDESPFMLHRHSSFGKDSDTEDSRKDAFHMHRLRSSRPRKANLEHTDSLSSGEEDDDDGFEILTAENLFSTLLSRVRDLTQRINVDDGSRPGFPNSRLLSHFDHGTNFWNLQNRMDPFSRTAPLGRVFTRDRVDNAPASRQIGAPWRRSVSRDLATDIESVFNDSKAPPTQTASLPRGEKSKNDNLNLSDLDLKQLKLSEEDAIALSYLTPGLSRRIQKQLLAQLPPSEARKLTRTMSMRNPREQTNSAQENIDQKSTSVDDDATRRHSIDTKKSESTLTNNDASKPDLFNESNVKLKDRYLPYNTVHDFSHPKSRAVRSTSLREPRSNYTTKFDKSPDSSVSDNLSCRTDYVDSTYSDSKSESSKTGSVYNTDSSASRPSSYALYSPESPALNKYLTPNKYYDTRRSYSPTYEDLNKKTDLKRPSVTTRRISRFLRPDFYEKPKEENVVVKEKKEREMETQKVLKEIRDKRKGRLSLHRGKSASREKSKIVGEVVNEPEINGEAKSVNVEDTKSLLNNVSTSIKNIETNVATIPDYVNEVGDAVVKKERLSKLIRPKSYPTETVKKEPSPIPEKEAKSKIGRLKKATVQEVDASKSNGTQKSSKNKFLQSIEKKFEKLRSFNSPSKDNVDEKKIKEDKNSIVESAIKQLREQSLPNKIDHCITESGLIKRAVSVEDLTLGVAASPKELQPSRKSVTKILGLFKKYEEKEKKTTAKLKKSKEPEILKPNIANPNADAKLESQSKPKTVKSNKTGVSQKSKLGATDESDREATKETNRPKSLPSDESQKIYNGAKTDPKDTTKSKLSKLPFRRSLNLDNSQLPDPPKFYKNPNKTDEQLNNNTKTDAMNQSNNNNVSTKNVNESAIKRGDRRNLMLDFSKIPQTTVEPTPCSSTSENNSKENRNSVATDDSSLFLSPYDDMSCDSWSVCSDHHTQDLLSPISPNGYVYSGDENESVIDRIRRKSFYTRFNEKKKPKKASLAGNYRDLDLYKDYSQRKPGYRLPNEYGSLDRKYADSRSPSERRSSYSSIPDPVKKDYKSYTRSSTLLNDYVNVPHRFQTYNPRMSRNVSLYSPETDDGAMDDNSPAGKSRKNSFRYQPSRLNNRTLSVSPSVEASYADATPAVNQNRITPPTI